MRSPGETFETSGDWQRMQHTFDDWVRRQRGGELIDGRAILRVVYIPHDDEQEATVRVRLTPFQ